MAKLSIKVGSTSQTVNLFIADSSSTTGAGLTGLVFNTSSLTAYYALPKAAAVSITLATLAAVTSAFSSGGFKEIDSTNMPGWYRFDIPDAALASGRFVSIHFKGAANMAPLPLEVELTAVDNQDAVRFGMTALPNANAEAAGGLYTRGTGAGQINQPANGMVDVNLVRWLGTAASTPTVAGVPNVNVKTWNDLTTVELPLVPTTAGRKLDVTTTGEAGIDWGNIGSPTTTVNLSGTTIGVVTAFAAGAIQSVWDALSASLTTANSIGKRLVDFITGDTFARLGAPAGASVSADIAAVKAQTGAIEVDTQDIQTRIPAALGANGNMKSDLRDVRGTALSANFAAGFIQFFDVATPTSDMNVLSQIVTDTTNLLVAIGLPVYGSISNDIAHAEFVLLASDSTILNEIQLNFISTDGSLNSIIATTQQIQTDVAALNNISEAEVLAQVNAALDTAIVELGQAIPTATPNLRTAMMLLYMTLRNKLQTDATEKRVYNNAGTCITKKALSDNGTVYDEAEMVAGP